MDKLQFNGSAFATAAIVSGIGYTIYAFTASKDNTSANPNTDKYSSKDSSLFTKAKSYFSDTSNNNRYNDRDNDRYNDRNNDKKGSGFFNSLNPFSNNSYDKYNKSNSYDKYNNYNNNSYNKYNKYNYGGKKTKKNRKS
jgi:hypothetical protein